MKTMEQFFLYCTMLCVFSALTATKKPARRSQLCKQTTVCEHHWEILCLSMLGQWSLTCAAKNVNCRNYWRKACTRTHVPFCQTHHVHCMCRCAKATDL
uniref:Uncharacterized protein n=1 Tax=Rhipicephalus zambeziensis TaxID=60191 RepID=A0A224YR55_9ACAR